MSMRKMLWSVGVLALAVTPVLAQDQPQIAREPWTCAPGYEGQTLSIYNWSTYVAENTISNFEAACGVTVNYDVFGNNEEMLARLRQGNPGFDISVPTDYAVAIMSAEGLLEPIDRSLVGNFANVSEGLTGLYFDPENAYSIPYQWGTVGIGYNIEAVGEEITSWEQVWNYDGPVAWLDDQRIMLGIALNLLGLDPNTQDPDEIAQARDFLIEKGSNVVSFAADDGQALLARGDVDIAIEYSGDIFQIMAEDPGTFNYVIPEEGTQIWIDNMVIPLDAPNPALAALFMDYILDPQVGADISNYTAFGSPNQAAIDQGLILPELLENPGIYPSDEIRERLYEIQDVPDAETDYSYAWDEIRVALGG
jgi:spermidine/putrescine transport system substrate-binding protein